jgi:hypothetical protein
LITVLNLFYPTIGFFPFIIDLLASGELRAPRLGARRIAHRFRNRIRILDGVIYECIVTVIRNDPDD